MNDIELLRQFRETGSEECFRELVQRHIGMVYSVALRQVRNSDWADEVAHAVFIALARKAGSLSDRTVIAGWLYRATRFAAGKLLRDEERRARHEKEAAMACLNDRSMEQQEPISWEELSPLVFETLDTLNRKDRDAILMRFMENRTFKEVAEAMGTTEAAAKMRTGRALEKLRERLDKQGVNIKLATLSSGLAAAALVAVPTALIGSVGAAALSQAASTATATSLAGSILGAFGWAKLKIAVAIVSVLIVGGAIVAAIGMRNDTTQNLMASPDDIVQRNGWTVDGRNVRSEVHQGQPAIDFDGQPGRSIAWRDGLNFSEGVIEVDIAALSGHMGIAYWVQDSDHYSAVYFRPQNRPGDPINGGHGVQYVALPDYGWARLRRESPGRYENPVSLPQADSGEWFHVRLEVSATQVQAFINHSTKPCLVVDNVLSTNRTGSVGVFMGTGSPGIFSNLKVQPARQR